MSGRFNPTAGLIIITAEVEGPASTAKLRLALDTGASVTVINPAILAGAGYDLSSAQAGGTMTTAAGVSTAYRLPLARLRALGHERSGLLVIAHLLPSTVKYDGLLGLDFLRGSELTIDFRLGFIRLA